MDPSGLALTASSAATFFYIVGGVLVVLALAITFVGMRREDFPSGRALRGILGLVALIVVLVCAGALVSARDEQEIRRAENEEAAKEAEAETEAEEATADEGAGQAAEPDSAADGAQVFVDTGCGSCHVLADAGTDGRVGPSLDEVLPGQGQEQIRSSIVEPGAQISEGFPAGSMPANYGDTLSEEELDALVAYLAKTAGS